MSRRPRKPTPQEKVEKLGRALRSTRAALRREMKRRREAEDDLTRATDPTLKELRLKDGTFDMELVGGACERMMAIFATSLIGAPNYREAQLRGHSNITGEQLAFTVTVQKQDGKTPHELRREAEANASALFDEVQALKKTLAKQRKEADEKFDDLDERYVALLESNNELLDNMVAYAKAQHASPVAIQWDVEALLDNERPGWNE